MNTFFTQILVTNADYDTPGLIAAGLAEALEDFPVVVELDDAANAVATAVNGDDTSEVFVNVTVESDLSGAELHDRLEDALKYFAGRVETPPLTLALP